MKRKKDEGMRQIHGHELRVHRENHIVSHVSSEAHITDTQN